MIENSPLGATAEAHLAIEDAVRALKPGAHHDLPLAIALQFYPGDQAEALRLARFLADLEPVYRDDVLLIFAWRFDVKMNRELSAAAAYCSQKFPVTHLRSARPGTGHLAGSWGLFAGIADLCYRNHCHLWHWANVFFVEPDGVPLRWDWIDVLKRAHAANLAQDKRVTGSFMSAYGGHVNGTHVHHCSFWGDHPSLQVCRAGCAWDLFHAQIMKSELGPSPAIANLYGAQSISSSVFRTLANECGHAWLANTKDESAWKCAQDLLRTRKPIAVSEKNIVAERPDGRAKPMNDIVTDIICKTYPRDYPWLPYLFRSLKRVRGYRNFVLVLEQDYPSPENMPPDTVVIRTRNYEPGRQSAMGAVIERLGIWRHSDAAAFVFVDSDCVFTRDVNIQTEPTIEVSKPVVLHRTWEEAGRGAIWRPKAEALLGYNPERETMCRYPFQFPRTVMEAFWDFVGGEDRMWSLPDLTDWNALGNFAIDKMPNAITPVVWSNAGAACVRQFWSWEPGGPNAPQVQREMEALGLTMRETPCRTFCAGA